ncbi:long-chain-fatty-acid--CoA ligase [Demequina zhanjiangensis]|uniref:Long-chain-fatty-acid--CoA ligase n=1 Tax=Demequina zhanjiangensis TaxID=3051659 RepID=A0ABT8G0G8_9MICO|nr:long-chain-fatty-acid--CoA ligase [Demequina sp. SYSU T00b26]MDN4472630.1 long-chain-fatty-acid--CoA ligase [Demequina sp. SYSU T00b26]
MSKSPNVIPASLRRNHWMNQVLGHAQVRPDATAFKHRGVVTTWSEVAEHMDILAAALQRRGVSFGDRVLMLTLNHTQVVETVFAINRLGAIAVPINIRLSPAEAAYIIDDADADVIIVDQPLAPLVAAAGQVTSRLTRTIVIGEAGEGQESLSDLLAEPMGDFEAPDVPEDTTCLIMYTSGTTGRPKGAMLDHGNMAAQAMTVIRVNNIVDESDVSFLTAPLFHIAGLGSIGANFILGIPTVLHPLGAFDPVEILDAWEAEGATIVFNVPQQWQAICAVPGVKDRDLPLRVISWGAAPASDSLLRTMHETFPSALMVTVFGQTEMSPITCVLRGEDALAKLGSVGMPVPTVQCRIVDADMRDVSTGEVGEIVYRGPSMMKGYWRKEEETASAFEGDWFHSGDLVRRDEDGFVWVVDRLKDMIISGGENVYCAEVENALMDHPAILDAAVYGRPDPRWGEVPVATLVTRPGESVDLAGLRTWLETRLAHYKQPKDIAFAEALPRNAAGKVDKVALRTSDKVAYPIAS